MKRIEPHPAWQQRFAQRLPFEQWRDQCNQLAALGKAADHAEHMLHAQLLEQGMASWMARALANRRREFLAVLRKRCGDE